MKRARDILDSLSADLTTAITDVTSRIMPAVLHCGLEELPNELLADILVRDLCRDRDYRHKQLKRVNKRFWSIVSSTRAYWWSLVETREQNPPDLCKYPVIRKECLPIDCIMGPLTPLPTFLHLKDRIRGMIWNARTVDDMEDLTTILGDERDLPSVKTLEINYDLLEAPMPLGWTFSGLTSLRCDGLLPSGPFPSLRHCVLDLDIEYDDISPWEFERETYTLRSYNAIYKLLASTPSLETLSFPKNGNLPLTDNDGMPKFIELPNLKKLSLRCSPGNDNFLKLLRCPRLETLEVDLEPFVQEHFRALIFGNLGSSFQTVTNLIITGGTNPDGVMLGELDEFKRERGLMIYFHGIHQDFPQLKRLSIKGNLLFFHKVIDDDVVEDSGPLALTSVSFHIPLKEHWSKIETIFDFYKKRKANLKNVEVRDWNRSPLRQNHTTLTNLSRLFPTANIRVDEGKRVPQV